MNEERAFEPFRIWALVRIIGYRRHDGQIMSEAEGIPLMPISWECKEEGPTRGHHRRGA